MALQLAQLPSDVLGLMLNTKDSSYLMIDLWKTGDVLLRAKLASAVTYLHLKDTYFDSTSRYPKLICELRNLRYLSLDRGEQPLMATSLDLSTEIQKLSSLRTLKLASASVDSCLLSLASDTSQANSLLALTSMRPLPSSLVDMSLVFPHLKKLKLKGPGLSPSPLARYPATLTTLKIPSMVPTASSLASLPRSLTKFKGLMNAVSSPSDWLHAPPSLTYISELDFTSLDEVPPMLLYTKVNCHFSLSSSELASGLSLLPPNLRKITIVGSQIDDNSAWISHLPRQLEHLYVDNRELTPLSVASLPPTLTELRAAIQARSSSADADSPSTNDQVPNFHWPPLLTWLDTDTADSTLLAGFATLSCLRHLSMHYSCAKLDGSILPRTLTNLVIRISSPNDLLILPGLPSGLRIICAFGSSSGAVKVESFPSFLLPSLHKLSLNGFFYPNNGNRTPMYTECIPLAPTLRALSILAWNPSWPLPPALTSLDIHLLDFFAKDVDLPHLDPFNTFPATLTHLDIKKMKQTEIHSRVVFSSLTRLKRLHCPALVHSSVLRGLSRSLTNLRLRMDVLAEEDAPALPPRLLSCRLDLAPMSAPSNISKYWPLSAGVWPMNKENIGSYGRHKVAAEKRSFMYPDPRVVKRTSKALSSALE